MSLINPLRYLWKALSNERSSNQIAWGIALGVLVGLVPKGNLTAWLFGTVLLSTKVNLGAGMLAAILISSVSAWMDPLTHQIGLRLLSVQSIQQLLASWSEKPLVAWLSLNNTVVLGSASLGVATLYPVKHLIYCSIEWVAHRYRHAREDSSVGPSATSSPESPTVPAPVAEG